MREKAWYFLLFIGAVILGSLWYGRVDKGELPLLSPAPAPAQVKGAGDSPLKPSSLPHQGADEISNIIGDTESELGPKDDSLKPPQSTVRQEAPSRESVRQAVARNPHVTPQPLIEFSVAIAQKMQVALESENRARSLFDELEECAVGADLQGRTSVQALCILNAKRLSARFPSLASRYEGLEHQADPTAVKMMRAAPQ